MARARVNVQCRVCCHPERQQIEKLMVSPSGPTLAELATAYGLSVPSLSRHRTQHLSAALNRSLLSTASPDAPVVLGEVRNVVERFRKGWDIVEGLMLKAIEAQNGDLALRAAGKFALMGREFRRTLELLGKATGELQLEEGSKGTIVVVVPSPVPVGAPADLHYSLPPGVTPETASKPQESVLDAEFEDLEPRKSENPSANPSGVPPNTSS